MGHSHNDRSQRHHRDERDRDTYDDGYRSHQEHNGTSRRTERSRSRREERSRSRHGRYDKHRDRSRDRDGDRHRDRGRGRDRGRDRDRSRDRDQDRDRGHDRRDKDRSRSRTRERRRRNRDKEQDREKERERSRYDDEEGHLIIKLGSDIADRYEIKDILGEGTFGKVVKCLDKKESIERKKEYVAIKIIKNVQRYRDAAEIEIDVLQSLQEKDPKNEHYVIHLKSTFDFRNHVCMVFEVLGLSIYDFLKENSFRPLPIEHVHVMAKQLLGAIQFMHAQKLTHTDLKPENILLYDSSTTTLETTTVTGKPSTVKMLKRPDIRLIDLGSATWEDQYHTRIVSTRHYRAPEVILELGWSYPCDMWSIGCILIELYTGSALFQTHENLEHLAMMEAILGPLPSSMLAKTEKTKYLIDGKLAWPQKATSTSSVRFVEDQCHLLEEMIHEDDATHEHFLDLLRGLLEYNPKTRMTASEALKHPFFTEGS